MTGPLKILTFLWTSFDDGCEFVFNIKEGHRVVHIYLVNSIVQIVDGVMDLV